MDDGTRYLNRRLTNFCRLEGIDLQTPAPFSLHKIDVAALMICTLKSILSCTIKAKSLDPSLEVEAISSATHILNRSPHPTLDGKTPFEAWCGRKPNVTHFRVFGCPTWANRSSRGFYAQFPWPCTFIGYEYNAKGI